MLEKKKLLPHFEVMNDRGEFAASRSRMRSERKYRQATPRSRSVESLKLPQVVEEKREEEDQKVARSKLAQFKDKNEFNQRSNRNSENNSDKGTHTTTRRKSRTQLSHHLSPRKNHRKRSRGNQIRQTQKRQIDVLHLQRSITTEL